MFWSLASMVAIRLAIWESRTPPDYSSKSPDHDIHDQGFLRLGICATLAEYFFGFPVG